MLVMTQPISFIKAWNHPSHCSISTRIIHRSRPVLLKGKTGDPVFTPAAVFNSTAITILGILNFGISGLLLSLPLNMASPRGHDHEN